jgi:hypothetical protein
MAAESVSIEKRLSAMTYRGIVQNGVIVLHGQARLPDGTEVSIVPSVQAESPDKGDDEPTIWQKLSDLGRWAETQPCDLPEDLAANHDHYLHNLPKRQ